VSRAAAASATLPRTRQPAHPCRDGEGDPLSALEPLKPGGVLVDERVCVEIEEVGVAAQERPPVGPGW
jgi:hypothetical protein